MSAFHAFVPLLKFLGWLLLAIVGGVAFFGILTFVMNLRDTK